jgi:D-alanyl-D-alanine dipeptidase
MSRRQNEQLTDLRNAVPGIVIALDRERLDVEETAFARPDVAKRLAKAQSLLPNGLHFIVRDAWRPAFVQAQIYFEFIERFLRKHPTWSRERAIEETEKFVADWKGPTASGHMRGAAIDVRIVDAKGRRVPMRSTALTYQENAAPDHPKLPARLRKNREMLRRVMFAAGFVNVYNEFWHFSYGDHIWAKQTGQKEKFSVIPDFHGMYADRPCPCGSTKLFIHCHATS